ncbi:MAG TPA: putative glycoside hydrolase, partial [Methylomirabilota bacterium]|nr:putative glycoside hydrolase [Methylomirabilota bacterium]
MTALIERDHVKSIVERGRHAIEPVGVSGAAVEEAEGRTAGGSPLEKAQRELADHDGTSARGLASQACDGSHAPNCIRKIFAWYALAHRLLSKVPMSDERTSQNRRRNVLDGAYTAGLLIVAILAGYALLAPSDLARATTLARPQPAPTPGPVSEYLGKPVERAPEPPRLTWPKMVSGQILDENRAPLEGASIVIGGVEHRTDAEGKFTVEGHPPDGVLLVKRPGYAKVRVQPTKADIEVVMKPQLIKAAYLTYFGFGHKEIRGRVLELAGRTEINAVVIDVKGDRGWIVYKTEVPEALAVGAQGPGTLKNFDELMADLKARGIYTIARIVTFKDNILANSRPDLAITDT